MRKGRSARSALFNRQDPSGCPRDRLRGSRRGWSAAGPAWPAPGIADNVGGCGGWPSVKDRFSYAGRHSARWQYSAASTTRSRWTRWRAPLARACARPRSPGASTASWSTPRYVINDDATLAIVTEKDAGRPRGHPPLHRAPAGAGGEGAVPGRAGDHRPGDRGRLLLRLRLSSGPSRPRIWRRSRRR